MYEKSLELRHFPVFPYPEEAELAPSWAAELAREGKDEENGFSGGIGCRIDGVQDAKKEILDKREKSHRDKEVSCEH